MILPKNLRFSMKTLLCMLLLVAIAATYFRVAYLDRYREEAEVLSRLESTGGQIHQQHREPRWLWQQFGNEIGKKGYTLILSDMDIGDEELADISQLSELGGLYLERTKVTDKGLDSIKRMSGLIAISLERTSISRWPAMPQLRKLEELDLKFTNVRDFDSTGLVSLKQLGLRGTKIDDDILAGLGPLPNLQSLDIAGRFAEPPTITDEGIAHLTRTKYPKLERIYLYNTGVSDQRVARLKAEFPGLKKSFVDPREATKCESRWCFFKHASEVIAGMNCLTAKTRVARTVGRARRCQ
jgi:hypothetical protein